MKKESGIGWTLAIAAIVALVVSFVAANFTGITGAALIGSGSKTTAIVCSSFGRSALEGNTKTGYEFCLERGFNTACLLNREIKEFNTIGGSCSKYSDFVVHDYDESIGSCDNVPQLWNDECLPGNTTIRRITDEVICCKRA